jgi:hypothetical protein
MLTIALILRRCVAPSRRTRASPETTGASFETPLSAAPQDEVEGMTVE